MTDLRTAAGNRYRAAVTELISAFIELAAADTLLHEGPGPKRATFAVHLPLANAMVLGALRHREFADELPKPHALRQMVNDRRAAMREPANA